MDFTQYQEVMTKVKADAASLADKLTDSEFKKFYEADKEKKNDQLLSFKDWKPIAIAVYPEATEEDLKNYFESASTDELMNFTQYQEVMTKVKADAAELTERLKDPQFKKFYDADLEKKNDQALSFTDWKPLAIKEYSEATDEIL